MTFREAVSGDQGALRLMSADLAFGTSPVTESLGALEAGDVVIAAWCEVLTAFNAGTTNVLLLGNTADDDHYLVAADITEGTPGVYPATVKQAFAAEAVDTTLTAKYTQTGTAATTGLARFYALVSKAPA